MGKFLNETGRPILYRCQWPDYTLGGGPKPNYATIRKGCNVWRNYEDVQDDWYSMLQVVDHWGDPSSEFAQFAGPGGWNDPEMLIVDVGLSYSQQKAQFGMWALWAAPLMMSVDLRSIDPAAKQLLLNKNIIAINQDPLGNQAIRLYEVPGSVLVWMKKLSRPAPGTVATGVLNKSNEGIPVKYTTSMADLGLSNKNGYRITEAFENEAVGDFTLTQKFTTSINSTSIYIMIAQPL